MNVVSNILEVNESDFNDKVIEASLNKLIVVDFWAPWCGPCKQLTPILESVAKKLVDKIILVKINIDDNQQIAAQLRIQSIPTVYAFKDKQIVNAFQGVVTEKQVIEFIEKSLGSKISEDFSSFYELIKKNMSEMKFEESKEALLDFITKKPEETQAIYFYLECLIELKQIEEAETFIESLEKEIQNNEEVKQILKKIKIIKNNINGPNIEDLLLKLEKKPKDINLVLEVADKYFSIQQYDDCMQLLLKNYPKNKNQIKEKMIELFEVLGNSSEYTITYRKRLSQIMFS
tara:strand:- start:2259 stop:3125 length:867 start_codon:yes stop_codon:yes gene_type:complete